MHAFDQHTLALFQRISEWVATSWGATCFTLAKLFMFASLSIEIFGLYAYMSTHTMVFAGLFAIMFFFYVTMVEKRTWQAVARGFQNPEQHRPLLRMLMWGWCVLETGMSAFERSFSWFSIADAMFLATLYFMACTPLPPPDQLAYVRTPK